MNSLLMGRIPALPTEVYLSALADVVVDAIDHPDRYPNHHGILTAWRVLTGATGDIEAYNSAYRVHAHRARLTAHVPPL